MNDAKLRMDAAAEQNEEPQEGFVGLSETKQHSPMLQRICTRGTLSSSR